MNRPNRRAILTAAVLGLLAATLASRGLARSSRSVIRGMEARTIRASFPGAGSFSFASSLPGVGLGNLTSFNFTLNEMLVNENGPSNTVQYGLADLNSFTASVGQARR